MLDDTIGPALKAKVAGVRARVRPLCAAHTQRSACAAAGAKLTATACGKRVAQIYKLADEFTFSGSEETFNTLQKELEGLEVRARAAAKCCTTGRRGAHSLRRP